MSKNSKLSNFDDKEISVYYNQRYSNGYMEDWNSLVQFKIKKIFHAINLPNKGRLLDYGCGQGVLTALLKQTLPEWDIVGVDISVKAIESARLRYPTCDFYVLNELKTKQKFDIVFTHHVLEHVLNLEKSLDDIASLCTQQGKQLHILPCGNPGSLEYRVAQFTKNGFEHDGRFFFEEEGHLRRLTADDLEKLLKERDFYTQNAWFSNHYYGALNWITELSSDFIKSFADPSKGTNFYTYFRLLLLRLKLNFIKLAHTTVHSATSSSWTGSFVTKAKMIIKYVISLPFIPISQYYKRRALGEFVSRSKDSRGSEMLMYFARESSATSKL